MGSIVTRDVPAHGLVMGNPAQLVGLVCRCGETLLRSDGKRALQTGAYPCGHCGREVAWP